MNHSAIRTISAAITIRTMVNGRPSTMGGWTGAIRDHSVYRLPAAGGRSARQREAAALPLGQPVVDQQRSDRGIAVGEAHRTGAQTVQQLTAGLAT